MGQTWPSNYPELDVINLSQSIWVWLIPKSFSGIVILDMGPIMCCYFVGPFLQSTLRPFYLGCRSNRFCLDNSLGCEVISYLHPCIIAGVLSHVWIFYFIIWLFKDSKESHLSWLIIFSSTSCLLKGRSCYFVAPCISIGTKEWGWHQIYQ